MDPFARVSVRYPAPCVKQRVSVAVNSARVVMGSAVVAPKPVLVSVAAVPKRVEDVAKPSVQPCVRRLRRI